MGRYSEGNRLDGFTVVEISIVIFIMLMLTALIFPVFKSVSQNISLDGVARDIASELKLSQQESISKENYRGIDFSSSFYRVVLVEHDGEYHTGITYLKERALPEGITCSANFPSVPFHFHPDGNPSSMGTVTLQTNGGKTKKIKVGMLGRIRIE